MQFYKQYCCQMECLNEIETPMFVLFVFSLIATFMYLLDVQTIFLSHGKNSNQTETPSFGLLGFPCFKILYKVYKRTEDLMQSDPNQAPNTKGKDRKIL